MVLAVESLILCALFTVPVYLMSRDPLKSIHNYPPRIQERVKSLEAYRDRVPTRKKKLSIKLAASLFFVVVLALILRWVNGCTGFLQTFGAGFLLWTAVNLYDLLVMDILWFCHNPRFVIKGTEDMTEDYHDYRFHIRGFFIGEALALIVCALAALLVRYVL